MGYTYNRIVSVKIVNLNDSTLVLVKMLFDPYKIKHMRSQQKKSISLHFGRLHVFYSDVENYNNFSLITRGIKYFLKKPYFTLIHANTLDFRFYIQLFPYSKYFFYLMSIILQKANITRQKYF